ncbi:MAG TPA: peptidylprolyl isomerase [Chloroflexi bacterium]|nr:peptidylprolyl isomerase [Chloroflexota bacterium]
MNTNTDFTQVADDLVVTMEYTLTVDGKIIDSSKDSEPICFLQGRGEIIPGLERQIYGMTLGENQAITVAAEEGYGEYDEDDLVEVSRDEFPESIALEVGVQLKLKDQDGHPLNARVSEIEDEIVILDFNHVLAGKELHFDVTVVELRPASQEELNHGHSH